MQSKERILSEPRKSERLKSFETGGRIQLCSFRGCEVSTLYVGNIELEKLGILGVRKFELDRWIDVGLNIPKIQNLSGKSGRKICKLGNLGKYSGNLGLLNCS